MKRCLGVGVSGLTSLYVAVIALALPGEVRLAPSLQPHARQFSAIPCLHSAHC